MKVSFYELFLLFVLKELQNAPQTEQVQQAIAKIAERIGSDL